MWQIVVPLYTFTRNAAFRASGFYLNTHEHTLHPIQLMMHAEVPFVWLPVLHRRNPWRPYASEANTRQNTEGWAGTKVW